MAGITGKDLYLAFAGTVLDTDYRSMSQDEEMGLVDASAGADTNRSYLTTLKDGTLTASIIIQSDDTTTWGAVVPGSSGTLEWAEEGTASGNMRHYVSTAYVASRAKSMEYADLVVADVTFQFSSAVTDTTY